MEMVIVKGESEFDVSVREVDGEWEGQIIEYNIGRLTPTLHLRHRWTSTEAALAGLRRRWQRLFPDEDPPDFREAITDYLPLREGS
jgi:hypothetical protein